MSDKPDISARIDIETAAYQRSMQRAIKQADEFDDALADLIQQANSAEKAIQKLDHDIKLEIDTNMSSLLDADRLIQSLDTTVQPLVDIQVANDAAVRSLITSLGSDITTKLKLDDSALKTLDLPNETVNVDLKEGDTSSAISSIEAKLGDLRSLAIIDVSMQLGEMLAPENIPLLSAAMDQDRAKRIVTAGTGGNEALSAQYGAATEDVYTSNFGASREEAARSVLAVVQATKDETGELTKTGEDFGKVTIDTYTTAINMGEDLNTVLAAQDALVRSGLVQSYAEAADVLNRGFSQGLHRSGDLLDTTIEYSKQFSEMGFSAGEMFNFLDQGFSAGARNTDVVADLAKEANIRVQAALSGEGAEFDALEAMGMMDKAKAYHAGEITGKEYMQGLLDAGSEMIASGAITPQTLFDALGTQAEDMTLEAVLSLNPTQVKEEFAKYDGTTVEVGAQLFGDAGSSIATLQRQIEGELATSFSNALDIPGKVQQLSDGVSNFSSLLDRGFTIPEAIEVAFEIPGFVDTVAQLQSTLGNLSLTIMEVAASILDAMGRGDVAGTVRGTVADQAERQLTFDLKLADDGAGISNAARAAIQRGVSEADVQSSLVTAGQEFIEAGDLEGARAYRDVLADMATIEMSPEMVTFLTGEGIDPTNLSAVAETLDKLNSLPVIGGNNPFIQESRGLVGEIDFAETATQALAPLDTALTTAEEALTTHYENMRMSAESKLPGMAEIATSSIAPVNQSMVDLSQAFATAESGFATTNTNLATAGAGMSTTLTGLDTNITGFGSNSTLQFTETVPTALGMADEKMLAFGETVLNTMLGASEQVEGLIQKLLSIGTLDITMPGIGGGSGGGGPIPGEAHGGQIPPGETHRVHAGELLVNGGAGGVDVLNRQTSSVIENAIAGYMASSGMGGGGGNVYNNQVYNVVFNNNGAAAAAASMDSAKLRGF